mgnify:FL=1|tara:strand:+ start:18312 stop:19376 length:1065 start_codon:yes stop_codon:yes gene_type:complete
MKLFQCGNCNNTVFFENYSCGKCGCKLGFLEREMSLIALDSSLNQWMLFHQNNALFTYCNNHQHGVCNWLVEVGTSDFCKACELNHIIPSLQIDQNKEKWQKLEIAKHRLIFQLLQLQLPIDSKRGNTDSGLSFNFLSKEEAVGENKNLMTGHANGVITILLSEADAVLLEKMKKDLDERYRTLIGHFRHEVGHYYWEYLIRDNQYLLDQFRMYFGDERISYTDALDKHYKQGPPANWQNNFISEYASSHPWEDWAETWAHYLHLMDTLETAYYFGFKVNARLASENPIQMEAVFDPYQENNFEKIVNSCIPLYFAMNSMNRSMGVADIYPFVISEPVIKKMNFIHQTVQTWKN